MKKILGSLLLLLFTTGSSWSQFMDSTLYEGEDLVIKQIAPNSYVHISYITVPEMGTFPCNGLIYANQQEAIVFDTPLEDATSAKLIAWIQDNLQAEVKAVVINHFHTDCLGGLGEFHRQNIPSYANNLTIELAKEKPTFPQHGFQDSLTLEVGSEKVINRYFGEGHSADNIVSYIPRENILFGGCMVKEVDASQGNLEDANVDSWPNTVRNIQTAYPDLKIVVPGHGQVGGTELLDYTIELFENEQ